MGIEIRIEYRPGDGVSVYGQASGAYHQPENIDALPLKMAEAYHTFVAKMKNQSTAKELAAKVAEVIKVD